ncbi:MAG: HAD family hydrolase, partial [Clostridia bacterium]|nr:HAD family hydrolase [Clostridia bacterium]
MKANLENVKLFLFDLDGTIYLGDNEIPGSYSAIAKLRKMGKKVCVFTNNSSRSHNDYIARLNDMGFAVEDEEVYTSGEVTA